MTNAHRDSRRLFSLQRPPSRPRRHRRVAVAGLLAVLGSLLTGCGPTVTLPDVVGMRLDAAHRAMEKLGVENFEDTDVVGDDRMIFLDSHWVVVEQSPAGGTKDVDTDTSVELSVGKADDDGILDLIPADSPVAEEFAAEAEAEAAQQAEEQAEAEAEAAEEAERERVEAAEEAEQERAEAAERLAEAREYAKKVAPLARGFNGVLRLYDQNAAYVRNGSVDAVTTASNALAAQEYFSTGAGSMPLAMPPDDLDLGGVNTDMALAMASMVQACDALLDAIDTGAPSAFAREQRLRDDGRDLWASSIRRIYAAAELRPAPLPPR